MIFNKPESKWNPINKPPCKPNTSQFETNGVGISLIL